MRKLPRFATSITLPCLALGTLIPTLLPASQAAAATNRVHHGRVHHGRVHHRRVHHGRVHTRRSTTSTSGSVLLSRTLSPRRLHITRTAVTPRRITRHTTPAPVARVAHVQVAATAGGVWQRLRLCESAGNYRENSGNGYYGAYQFSLTTWHAIGGVGDPDQAPPTVQDAEARHLLAVAGWGSWPDCSYRLGLS